MAERLSIALIDDDDAILDSLQLYLGRRGVAVSCFRSTAPFLDALGSGTAFDCVVTDVKMPGMSGVALQRALAQRVPVLPVILITGHGDVDMAVSAIKAGAFDLIEKPVDDRRLLSSISEAVRRSRETMQDARELAVLQERYAQLSERQRQVMELAVEGFSNKEIAARLGISPRTAEHYREMAMERMQASGLAELVYMAVRLRGQAGASERKR
jgi:two-component system response regulator FixJ